jgi:hypothetical protein
MNLFYTYAYLRDDGSPYYIGKGIGNRAYSKHRKHIKVPNKNRILILKNNLTEEDAFKHEIYMISVFGRKDLGNGILINLSNGGDGVSGYKHTGLSKYKMQIKALDRPPVSKETKEKISKTLKGRKKSPLSEEQKKKISETKKKNFKEGKYKTPNGMLGKKHKEETKKKMSAIAKTKNNSQIASQSRMKKVMINGTIYNSRKEAIEKTGISWRQYEKLKVVLEN